MVRTVGEVAMFFKDLCSVWENKSLRKKAGSVVGVGNQALLDSFT